MIKAYKYRLNPTDSQIELMNKTFGCCRYVYNWALQRKIESYQNDKQRLTAIDLCKELTHLKKEEDKAFLKEVANACLQQSIRNMDIAFTKFFREHTGFPKFKSKHKSRQSFKNVECVYFDFENNTVQIPKLGLVKFYANRKFNGKQGTSTISKTPTGKLYISVVVDDGLPTPEKKPITIDTAVGIDVGIKDFAVLSNGQVYENPKYYENNQKRLAILQRRMARKQKGSNRYNKSKLKVALQHEKITNKRRDYLHKVSSKIISENQTVIIEDLNVDGMLKNHCLAKSISSVSWSEFFRMLEYKSEWNGVNLIRIGRFEPSSKMCYCGYVHKDLKLKDREWTCPSCGSNNDRDLLAAQNIKRFGLDKQNLISQTNISPVVHGVEDVELWSVDRAEKRQKISILVP